jgi:hypothetical protein
MREESFAIRPGSVGETDHVRVQEKMYIGLPMGGVKDAPSYRQGWWYLPRISFMIGAT